MASKSLAPAPVLTPRFRVLCGKNIALGPGKVELLVALLETGSLTKAARRLRMSYMRAWTLVTTMTKFPAGGRVSAR
jgi:molybdate transport system regulatory protein